MLLARDLAGIVSGLRDARQHEMLLLVDREPVHTFWVSRESIGIEVLSEKPLKVRVPVKAGPHELAVTFVKVGSLLIDTARQPTVPRV